jgi:hypothetical protein
MADMRTFKVRTFCVRAIISLKEKKDYGTRTWQIRELRV